MGRLLQLLALFFVVRYVFRAVARWLTEGTEQRRVGSANGKPVYRGRMVRDPVCGLFLLQERALEVHEGGETHHFCSEKCREAFGATKMTGVTVG
jgi:YHS domain-containing protein